MFFILGNIKEGKMKLKLVAIGALLASAVSYGASIDHIQTYTPEYLANQAQTGMLNEATSANYNPAGLARLSQGKYVNTGLQYAFGNETMSYDGKEHKAKLRQAIPNLALYSVDNSGANFMTFGGVAGGGKLKYHGVAGLDVSSDVYKRVGVGVEDNGTVVEGSNKYYQMTLGRAFKVDDKLSLSLAGRVVYGVRSLKGNIELKPSKEYREAVIEDIIDQKVEENAAPVIAQKTAQIMASPLPAPAKEAAIQQATQQIEAGVRAQVEMAKPLIEKQVDAKFASSLSGDMDSTRRAWGYGFQLGANYKFNDKLNLAARYDSRVKMNFKARGHENQLATSALVGTNLGFSTFYPQYIPGTKTRRDLPAILALGASYQATDKWLLSTAGNFYFNRHAKMDRVTDAHGHTHGHYKNGWELALGTEYKLNDKFTLLGSVNYAYTGAPKNSYSDVEYAINSTTLGAGLRYQYDETLAITASVAHFFYKTSEGNFKEKYGVENAQKYSKKITAFGIGLTKKF